MKNDRNRLEIDRNGLEIDRNGLEIDRNGLEIDRNGLEIDRNGLEIDRNGLEIRDVPIPKFEPIPVPILNFKAKPIFGFFSFKIIYIYAVLF